MTKDLRQLVLLVITEAMNLREHATREQKDELNFVELRPSQAEHCIYGQMTGHCYSREALDLIRKCALKVYNTHGKELRPSAIKNLNGVPRDFSYAQDRNAVYHSPIELFILIMNESENLNYLKNNKILIDYIKGYTDELVFNFTRKSKKTPVTVG